VSDCVSALTHEIVEVRLRCDTIVATTHDHDDGSARRESAMATKNLCLGCDEEMISRISWSGRMGMDTPWIASWRTDGRAAATRAAVTNRPGSDVTVARGMRSFSQSDTGVAGRSASPPCEERMALTRRCRPHCLVPYGWRVVSLALIFNSRCRRSAMV